MASPTLVRRSPRPHAHEAAAARAERGPNTDLVRALHHRIRDHAVDADAGEQQRGGAEDNEERRLQAVIGHRQLFDLIHGAEVVQRLVLVDAVNSGAD
jgi:hypothetical protein